MNAQEQQQLGSLLQRLSHVQSQQNAADIDTVIRDACARQPETARALSLLLARQLQGLGQPSCFHCAPPEGSYAFETAGLPPAH